MRLAYTAVLCIVVAGAGAGLLAQSDRLTDKDLKQLVEQIDKQRESFQGALDPKLKSSKIRQATGEVDVERYLNDFKDNIGKLKDRLKDDYSASAEATTVLRQATDIDAFFKANPLGKAESEWNRLSAQLKTMAGSYGAGFPLAAGASVRRMSKGELSGMAKGTADSVDKFRKALENDLKADTTMDKAAKESILKEAEQLKKDAEGLASVVSTDKLSSGEADKVISRAKSLQTFMAANAKTTPTSTAAWASLTQEIGKIAGEYAKPWIK